VATTRRVPSGPADGADHTAVIELAPAPPGRPEAIARAVFEGGPAPLRLALRLGWRYGLGLRLAAGGIGGWTVVRSDDEVAEFTATGHVDAVNRVERAGDVLRWTTSVRYRSWFGRLVWSLAVPVHVRSLPWLLRRAARAADR
jgi:hypothetical protein